MITATIDKEPDRVTSIINYGPRVMIAKTDLASSGLVQPGSLIRYGYRVLLPPGSPAILHLRAEVVREGLAVLERAALHELAWHQAEGRVEPGLLDPEELAEKVMVRELPKLAPHDKPVAVVLRLRRQVVAEVRAAVERLLLDPTHVLSMDQRVPSQPEALQVSPLGGELLDYWQPDETLSLQDVLGTSPEDPA